MSNPTFAPRPTGAMTPDTSHRAVVAAATLCVMGVLCACGGGAPAAESTTPEPARGAEPAEPPGAVVAAVLKAPGVTALELPCGSEELDSNGVDDNCNGVIDEGSPVTGDDSADGVAALSWSGPAGAHLVLLNGSKPLAHAECTAPFPCITFIPLPAKQRGDYDIAVQPACENPTSPSPAAARMADGAPASTASVSVVATGENLGTFKAQLADCESHKMLVLTVH